MRLAILLTIWALLCAAPLAAQSLPDRQRALALGGVRPLSSADEARLWSGVGRLDTGVSFCTAVLIAPDLALTAAHCLFHPATGARLAPGALQFLAGLRNGRPETIRAVRAATLHDAYIGSEAARFDMIGRDLALLHLALPIRAAQMPALAVGAPPEAGEAVTVVSYGAGREAVASIEEDCLTLTTEGAVLALSCEVVGGSSGAPVIRMTAEGPQVVGIVSATATDRRDGMRMSLAVSVSGLLEVLRSGGGAAQRPVTGGEREGIGARFIRP